MHCRALPIPLTIGTEMASIMRRHYWTFWNLGRFDEVFAEYGAYRRPGIWSREVSEGGWHRWLGKLEVIWSSHRAARQAAY